MHLICYDLKIITYPVHPHVFRICIHICSDHIAAEPLFHFSEDRNYFEAGNLYAELQ